MSRSRIRVENGTVVSDRGTLLRGGIAEVYGWGKQTGETAYATDPTYYNRLRRARLNAVRAVCSDPWQRSSNNPHWDLECKAERGAFLAELDLVVELSSENDLYVLIDYHDVGTYDLTYLKTFWNIVAPRYAHRTNVFFELANEPASWRPNNYSDQVLRDQEEVYQLVRELAPETHLVLLSFANTVGQSSPSASPTTMIDVVERLRGIDWTNASVSFHPYQTPSSKIITDLREKVPVISTELDLPAHAGGVSDHHLYTSIDAAEYAHQVMEGVGVSWFGWGIQGPEKLEKYFQRGVLADAKAKGYIWEADWPTPRGLADHSAVLAFFREFPVAEAVRIMQMKRLHVAACVGLSAIAAVLDGLMLLTLIPISQGAAEHNFDFIWKWPVLRLLRPHTPPALHNYAGTFLCLALFAFLLGLTKSLAYYGIDLSVGRLYGKYSARLSDFVFRRYLSFGKDFFDAHSTGKMAAVIDYNHDLLNLFQALLRLTSETLVVTVCTVVMFAISWRLTLVVLLVFPFLHFVRRWIAKKTAGRVRQSQAMTLRVAAKSYDVLKAIHLYRSFAKEDEAARAHAKIMEQVRKANFYVFVYAGLLPRAQEVTTLLAMLLILILAFAVEPGRAAPVALLFVFFFIARLTLPRLGVFQEVELQFEQKMPKMLEYFDLFNDNGKFIAHKGTLEFRGLVDSIRFQQLTFAYPNRKPVLHDVSFVIPKGRMTALVGPSGAGKTTLASLLLRYHDVSPHRLVLDGRNIRMFTSESLRRNIAFVSQDVVLLDDTLRNNLIFGLEGKIEDSDLRQAVARACLEELVDSLPKGLETMLGSDGVTLSGGQRQRVAIARALLKKAPVLILDEATSSLDSETERIVQKAIENAVRGCTSLVIAHRLSTIQRADKVVVLESGRVSEEGTLRQLLDRRGRFYAMWKAQAFNCSPAEGDPAASIHDFLNSEQGEMQLERDQAPGTGKAVRLG